MAISASQIVQVNPRLLKPGGTDLELNGLFLSKNASIPAHTVLPFGEPEAVGAYFGLLSAEYAMAEVYFLGYNNSFLKPRALYFGRRLDKAAAPWLRGGKVLASVASLKTIVDGSISLILGAYSASLTGISFASITSYSDAAIILQGAIRAETAGGTAWTAATVVYDSIFDAVVLTGGATGTGQAVADASGPLASTLCLDLASGAVLSQGVDAAPVAENMLALTQQTSNWATLAVTWDADEAEVLDLGRWANAQGVNYLFVFHDADALLVQAGNAPTIAKAVSDAELSAVAGVYGSKLYAAFICGCIASIDYNRRAGTISTAFKSQDGLAPTVDHSSAALNLMAKKMNFYGNYATRNDQFVFLYPGCMFGRYLWIDPFVNAIWLHNALQVALMAGLQQTPRVPYTDAGYALVRSWLQDPLNRALRNGVIDAGVTLSEAQKTQINREAGRNIAPEVQATGYFALVEDAGPHVRTTRDSPTVSLWYTYGGSINRLVVASTALV